jgi:hypothetical protein
MQRRMYRGTIRIQSPYFVLLKLFIKTTQPFYCKRNVPRYYFSLHSKSLGMKNVVHQHFFERKLKHLTQSKITIIFYSERSFPTRKNATSNACFALFFKASPPANFTNKESFKTLSSFITHSESN